MYFCVVVMVAQLVHRGIGGRERLDAFCREESGQAVLPELVQSLDLALGLWRRRILEGDVIEMQGLAQIGQGVRHARKEKAMIIHIERQRQAVHFKSTRQKIQIGGQVFVFIKPCTCDDTAAIIEHVEKREPRGIRTEPSVRRHVQLPERADLPALPTPDGGGRDRRVHRSHQLLLSCPTADRRAIHRELMSAQRFRGREAVRRRRLGRKQCPPQRGDGGRNDLLPVATGVPRHPCGGLTLRTCLNIGPCQLRNPSGGKTQFLGRRDGRYPLLAILLKDVPNERDTMPGSQLGMFFFIGQFTPVWSYPQAHLRAPQRSGAPKMKPPFCEISTHTGNFNARQEILIAPRQNYYKIFKNNILGQNNEAFQVSKTLRA